MASTKIPFTSEAKEAIASIPEIQEEIELAVKACGRRLKTHLNKKERKSKTRAKFEIVQQILPVMAQKCATIVKKPVPDLSGTITKIMNVVWIDDSIEYAKGKHKVSIKLYNYTPKQQKLDLHTVLPRGALNEKTCEPKPAEVKDGTKVTWRLPRIPTTEVLEVDFTLEGLEQDEFDETELYVSEINPVFVMGADPLPGDWDLQTVEFTEVEAPPEQAEEEEEPDYDESGEELNDEQ